MTPTQCCLSATILAWASTAAAGEAPDQSQATPYSPKLQHSVPIQVFWGDTHLHTNLSYDAYSHGGNKRLGLDEAYRFAKGEVITTNKGLQAQINRPLDFLVVADHGYLMGVFNGLAANHQQLADTPFAQQYARQRQALNQPNPPSEADVLSKLGQQFVVQFQDAPPRVCANSVANRHPHSGCAQRIRAFSLKTGPGATDPAGRQPI